MARFSPGNCCVKPHLNKCVFWANGSCIDDFGTNGLGSPPDYTITATFNGTVIKTYTGHSGGLCFNIDTSGTYVVSISGGGYTFKGPTSYTFTIPGTTPNITFSGDYHNFPSCLCGCNIGSTLSFTSTCQTCNCGMFQSKSLSWGDSPVAGGPKGYYSSSLSLDCKAGPGSIYAPYEGSYYYYGVCSSGVVSIYLVQTGTLPNQGGAIASFGVTNTNNVCSITNPAGSMQCQYPVGNYPSPSDWCCLYGCGSPTPCGVATTLGLSGGNGPAGGGTGGGTAALGSPGVVSALAEPRRKFTVAELRQMGYSTKAIRQMKASQSGGCGCK